MDRAKRVATKVTDFRKYHLSGDLGETLRGRVNSHVTQYEMASEAEILSKELEEAKANYKKMMEEAEIMKIRNKLEIEKLQQEQWQTTIAKLQEARSHAAQEHAKVLEQIQHRSEEAKGKASTGVLDWFNTQMETIQTKNPKDLEMEERARQQRLKEIQELKEQQENIGKKIAELEGTGGAVALETDKIPVEHITQVSQEALLQQLKDTLMGKKEEDPNKAILKAVVTNQNKMTGEGGTNTLKPNILNSLLMPESGSSMAD